MKIIDKIKKAFKNFGKKSDKFIYENLIKDESIHVVNDLKRFFEMPFFDGIVQVSLNKVDNVALPIIRKTLDEAIIAMKSAGVCKDLPSQEARLKCFISVMRDEHKDELGKIYLRLAAWYFKKRSEQSNVSIGLSSSEKAIQDRYNELQDKGLI